MVLSYLSTIERIIMNNYRIRVYFISLFYSTCVLAQADFPIIQYENGKLKTQFLPYGKKFIVKGSCILANGDTTDLVVMTLKKEQSDTTSLVESFWKKKDNQNYDFELFVDRSLDIGANYHISFYFFKYQPNSPIDTPTLKEIIDSSINFLELNGYLSGKSTKSLIGQMNEKFRKKRLPEFSFGREIQTLLGSKVKIESLKKELAEPINEKVFLLKNAHDTNDSLASVRNKIDSLNKIKSKFLVSLKADSTIIDSFLTTKDVSCKISNVKVDSFKSDSVKEYVNSCKSSYEHLKRNLNDSTKLQDELTIITKTLDDAISKANSNEYILASDVKALHYAYASETDIRALRIRTDYSLAVSMISFDKPDYQALYYLGFRIYFNDIDKSLRDPYKKGIYSRLSFVIGAVVLDKLKYKGKKLEDIENIGLKVITGLGADINKYFGVNMGLLWCEQKTVKTLSTRNYLKASPFMSFSFDFDIINKLKNSQ